MNATEYLLQQLYINGIKVIEGQRRGLERKSVEETTIS